MLESIFLTAFGKSFLNVMLRDMVPWEGTDFRFRISLVRGAGTHEIGCGSDGKRLELELDGNRSQTGFIREVLYPVFFTSTGYLLEIESVPHLRRLMNRFICGVDALYIRYILSYNQALKQKNHLLRFRPEALEIGGWNRVLSETGTRIMNARKAFINDLNREIRNQGMEEMRIEYIPSIVIEPDGGMDAFNAELERMRSAESRFQRSVAGPHRDRYEIRLGNLPLKHHSSGEKKIHLLMAYIAFIRMFQNRNGDFPVFLVDDYDTAMDSENIRMFMDAYPEMQVIATSVNPNGRFDRQIELAREN